LSPALLRISVRARVLPSEQCFTNGTPAASFAVTSWKSPSEPDVASAEPDSASTANSASTRRAGDSFAFSRGVAATVGGVGGAAAAAGVGGASDATALLSGDANAVAVSSPFATPESAPADSATPGSSSSVSTTACGRAASTLGALEDSPLAGSTSWR